MLLFFLPRSPSPQEEQNRGKVNWEHLNDELHVLITVEDTQNRAQVKLKRALEEVKQLLVPIVSSEHCLATCPSVSSLHWPADD